MVDHRCQQPVFSPLHGYVNWYHVCPDWMTRCEQWRRVLKLEPYAGRAAAAGLFCNAAAADKNASARRRRFRGRRAAVKVSDPISFSGENLHTAYNF